MRSFLKRSISFLITLIMLMGFFTGRRVLAADTLVQINVAQDSLLDVVLTLGQTDSDVSNVGTDLKNALITKGIPSDKINIQAVQASQVSAGNTTSGWKTYDHYGNYGEQSYPSPDTAYSGQNHIIVKNGGAQITFYGYGDYPILDFMYMPNDISTKKTFSFTMDDNNVNNHSMFGGGFLFNTKITNLNLYATQQVAGKSIVVDNALNDEYITGYLIMMFKTVSGGSYPILYKINNVSLKAFHDSRDGNIDFMNPDSPGTGITVLQKFTSNELLGNHSITVEVSGNTINMQDTVGSTTKSLTYTGLSDTGSYGFGPAGIYKTAGHSCNQLSWFNFQNLQMQITSAKRFSEVIREPQWRDGSKRFVINAEDGAVSDFSDSAALGEILSRLGNENIAYIGWGRDETDGNAFIAKNDGNGLFVDKDAAQTDTYAEQIQAFADYIYGKYRDSVVNSTDRLIYGKPSSLAITPESEQTNTIDANWPNGKWRVEHDENYYQNPTGVVPYDGLYLNNLDISFTEAGEYKIYYQDTLIKTVYVHRKPIASFGVSVDASYNVTITDNAYDPDYETNPDKGIKSETWQYKETTSDTWTNGKPTSFSAGKNYVIKQVVVDNYDVESDPYYRYITTVSTATSTPVAEFKITPSRLLTYISQTVEYEDTSYDPSGLAITSRTWKVLKDDNTEIYSSSTPKTDFTGVAAGTYKITLTVKNVNNTESEEVARFLTVVRDITAPTATCNTSSGTYNQPKTVTVTFADETGGSGFNYRYAVITNSLTTPSDWGSMGTNDSYSVTIGNLGTNYVYYKVRDYAGNERIAYFGPFTLVDNTAPSSPTITTSPSYTDGTWATQAITVSASASTDNFTPAGSIVYQVSTNGSTYNAGNSVLLNADGTYTVYFKVLDGTGNSTVANKTVKVDLTNPSVPTITMTSNGSTYVENTWATKNVSISLTGSTDGTGSGVSGYQYKIDGGTWQNGSSYLFAASGQHTFYYRAVDNAGNYSDTASKNILVDLAAPTAPTISTSPSYTDGSWANRSITVSASGSTDDLTASGDLKYEVSTNGTTYSLSNSITLDTDATHTVYFRVTDEGGNSTVVSKTIKVDRTNPSVPNIAMTSDGKTYVENTWATKNVQCALSDSSDGGGSGINHYQYKIDAGDWQDGNSFMLSASGVYTVQYRSVDNAGNLSDAGSKTVKIDLEAPGEPTITVTPTYAKEWSNQDITLTALLSTDNMTPDTDILYEVSTDGTNYSSSNTITLSTDGVHTIYFRVTDEGGNSTVVSKTIKIDKTTPSVPNIAMTSDGKTYAEDTWTTKGVSITLSGSTDAGGSTLSGYQYKIGDGSWQDGATYTFNSSGKYTIYYRSVDKAGNLSGAASKHILVDMEAPSEPTVTYDPDYTTEWINKDIKVSAQGSTDNLTPDAQIKYEVSTDGIHYAPEDNITLDADGVYTVCFMVTDLAGLSTVVTRTVNVDKTVPSIPDIDMTSQGEGYSEKTWATASVVIALSGSTDTGGSGLSGYQYKVDDGEWRNGNSFMFDASGQYTFAYRSIDYAGNVSEAGSKSIFVDLEDPEAFTISTSVTTINSIDISAATTDALSGMAASAYRIFDGYKWSDWKSAVNETLTGYARGETVTIKVEAKDVAGNIRTVETTVMTLWNTAPVAYDDNYTLIEDASKTTLDVLANDQDNDIGRGDGDALSIAALPLLSNPDAGKLTLSDGILAFTPAANFNGTVSFSYIAEDRYGAMASGVVSIDVTAVNDRPVANDDRVATNEDQSIIINVLQNDTDVDSTLSIASFGSAKNGMVSKSGSSLKYVPQENYFGQDSFTYTVTDGALDATATVYVTVNSVNDSPVLKDDQANAYYEQAVTIDVLANDTDIDGDQLTITAVTGLKNGQAEIKNNKILYTPVKGYTGTDTFSYTATDGKAQISASVTVQVSYPAFYDTRTAIFNFSDLLVNGDTGASGNSGSNGNAGTNGNSGNTDSNNNTGGGGNTGSQGDIQVLTQPANGTLNTAGGNIYYTPDEGTQGIDTYRVVVNTSSGPVEYQVITNTDPATGQTTTLGYGQPLSDHDFAVTSNNEIRINLADYLGIATTDGNVSILVNGQPVNGKVEIVNGQLIYHPSAGFTGTDAVVITLKTGDRQIPYAVTFNVAKNTQPLFSWWCVIGWVIMALLLWLNHRRHKAYYQEKKRRTILYSIVSILVMLVLCYLRIHIGFLVPIILAVLYIAANYMYAALMSRRGNNNIV